MTIVIPFAFIGLPIDGEILTLTEAQNAIGGMVGFSFLYSGMLCRCIDAWIADGALWARLIFEDAVYAA